MNNIYKIKLLANLPIFSEKIPIYSPSLKSIAEIGKDQYAINLLFCTITKDSNLSVLKDIFNKDVNINQNESDFDLLVKICLDYDLFHLFVYSLFYFTKLEFNITQRNNEIIFYNNDIEINKNNYASFIKCIKYANCIEISDIENMDEFDKRVAEMEKKIKEQESKNKEPIELEDLVSYVANLNDNGLSILNIWDLNVFQLYEQLQRGQLKENYYIGIKQLLAGAKPDDIKLENYFKKID